MKLLYITLILCFAFMAHIQQYPTTLEALKNSKSYPWFTTNYHKYKINMAEVSVTKPLIHGISVVVFAGIWCSDSHMLLPSFAKWADTIGIAQNRIQLVWLDENKTSPGGLEKKYKIHHIPVFIFIKDGKEAGRITETVTLPLETEIKNILKK